MLALENIDHDFVNSVEKALSIVNQLNSPWFNIYPDIGNLAAYGYDPIEQLPLAKGRLVGVHVKDSGQGKSGEFRSEKGLSHFRRPSNCFTRWVTLVPW